MSKITAETRGLARTQARLNELVIEKGDGALKGLLAGGLLIQRRAQKRTPVEYGLLRASAFTRRAQDGSLSVEIGYSALYAKFVHDKTSEKLRGVKRPSGLGTYWNPGGSQFLKKAYDESISEVVQLIRKHARQNRGASN